MKENIRFIERKQESIHCQLESDLYKYSAKRENGHLGGDPRRCVVYLVTTLVLEKRTQVAGLQMHTTTQQHSLLSYKSRFFQTLNILKIFFFRKKHSVIAGSVPLKLKIYK